MNERTTFISHPFWKSSKFLQYSGYRPTRHVWRVYCLV